MHFRNLTQLIKNKRFWLTLLLLIGVAGYFWSQSRYPQLDHKAMMGSDIRLEAIGFDVLLVMPESPSIPRRILVDSVNWMYTNYKGMTFGIIFGAILMSMLPFLVNFQFRSGIANSALGVVIGAPLGLCVNCSTPIAHGMYAKGARPETMLATMISSPTLNIIVLTMLFTMFPPWLAIMKIGSTAVFVLIAIPLLTRWLKPNSLVAVLPEKPDIVTRTIEKRLSDPLCEVSKEQCDTDLASETWLAAATGSASNLGRNLLYLIKIAVPLMILAGILGATMVAVLPLDKLAAGLPDGRLFSWVSMGVLAIVGLFLPSPMTFDVILSAVLYNAGMPVKYVAVLLFTLGIFSIYPFMTLWRYMSPRMAVAMFTVLTVMGVSVGLAGNRYHLWDKEQQKLQIMEPFFRTANPPKLNKIDRTRQGAPAEELLPTLADTALRPEAFAKVKGLEVSRIPFDRPRPAQPLSSTLMHRYDQREFGITEHENYSSFKTERRFEMSRGISSGDANRDGRPDLLITSDAGLALYLNKSGTSFVQQRLEIPMLNQMAVPLASLVDLNNDGWLDIWFSTLRRGNYVVYSENGLFLSKNVTPVENHPDAVSTGAAAFGDLDRDGRLDIVLGNVSAVERGDIKTPYKSMKNIWLRQQPDGFVMHSIPGIEGESLSALLSDINQDGRLDLLVGNDHRSPDMVYLGDGKGGLRLQTKLDGSIPNTPDLTMSIASADLDNDLNQELFFGSVSLRKTPGQEGATRYLAPAERCAELTDQGSKEACIGFYKFRDMIADASSSQNIWACRRLPTQTEQDACTAHLIGILTFVDKNQRYCDFFPAGWEYLSQACRANFAPKTEVVKDDVAKAIPQRKGVNVLLTKNSAEVYEDKTLSFGLVEAGWTWNAKFADLDNDGWQDLFAVNGYLLNKRSNTNFFYRNQDGKRFADNTKESGLGSYLDTLSYTYLDIENDGDMDIIVVPSVGPLSVYINQTVHKESVAFELQDGIGNYDGIGSKIIIRYGDGGQQMREIQTSGGYLSYDAPVAYFDLDDEDTIKSVEVEWSTGEKSVMDVQFESGFRYIIKRSK